MDVADELGCWQNVNFVIQMASLCILVLLCCAVMLEKILNESRSLESG